MSSNQTSRREFLRTMTSVAAWSAGFSSLSAQLKPRPNMILCMADDQGWGDMGYNNHPFVKTPHFDKMAAEAFRFDRFYAAAPTCSPTRVSVLTGRNPNRVGTFDPGYFIRPQEVTLAQILKKQGYATGLFGKWHVGSVEKNSPVSPGACGFDTWIASPNYYDLNPVFSKEGFAIRTRGEGSMVTVEHTLDFIRSQVAQDRPFLALVWFGSPHNPYHAMNPDRAFYRGRHNAPYYREITAMDRAFGHLREEIAMLGLKNNTIVWYCSDNGGPVKKYSGGRGKKASIYEGGLRVPALLEYPALVKQPTSSNMPCVTSDMLPTLLDLAGIKGPGQRKLDGISLVPLLTGRMRQRPGAIGFWRIYARTKSTPTKKIMKKMLLRQARGGVASSFSFEAKKLPKLKKNYKPGQLNGHVAWLDWPYKLHYEKRRRRGSGKLSIKWELYDLEKDPGEKKNIIQQLPKRVSKMKKEMMSWMSSVVNSLNGADY